MKSAHTWILGLLAFSILVHLVGIPVTIMEPDAATYAIISMEMLDRGSAFITARGLDWLDKPHFQFWITALSLKVFGVTNFGYKFPAIIFSLIGIRFTYLFALHYYSKGHAWLSVLLMTTSLHFILSNNDVRAEPFLLGGTILSVYYFAKYLEDKKFRWIVFGSFGLGILLMTKGLFTILPVGFGVLGHLLVQKRWRDIIHPQWLIAALLTLVAVSPVLIAYYFQFDAQPDKVIHGQTGVSGIKFFFWDSQWGRFTNTGPIKGQGDLFFFLHTTLWAFAPWAFLFFFALVWRFRRLRKDHFESYTLIGVTATLLLFSFSKFQLPHYIVPLFPMMAVVSADALLHFSESKQFRKVFVRLHTIQAGILVLAVILLAVVALGRVPSVDVVLLGMVGVLLFYTVRRHQPLIRIVVPAGFFTLWSMYFMNRDFYPMVMQYQSESEVAFYIKENQLPADQFSVYGRDIWITDFYLHTTLPVIKDARNMSGLVFVSEGGLKDLQDQGIPFNLIETFPDFHVTTLTGTFLNKSTRKSVLQNNYLIQIP